MVYFDYSGLFTLREENGWSYERGTMARRTSEMRSTSKSPALLKVSESRRMREPSSAPRVRQFATSARPPSIWKIHVREEARGIRRERKRLPLGRPGGPRDR